MSRKAEPRTVYAVSSGSYSDYSVDCLFTTREMAEAYAEQENRLRNTYQDDFEVQEFDLYRRMPEMVLGDTTRWTFRTRKAEADRDKAAEAARGATRAHLYAQAEAAAFARSEKARQEQEFIDKAIKEGIA